MCYVCVNTNCIIICNIKHHQPILKKNSENLLCATLQQQKMIFDNSSDSSSSSSDQSRDSEYDIAQDLLDEQEEPVGTINLTY